MSKTLISLIAGLGAMLGWGVSDVFANVASEKFGHTKTFFYSQIAGIILMVVAALLWAADFSLDSRLVPILLLSGTAYALAYLLFYRGFEIGNISVVAAVINLQQLFIIGISFFVYHQTLSRIQIPAIIAILTGVTLVSVDFKEFTKKGVILARGVKETVFSSILFGVIYWPTTEYIVERSNWITSSLYIKVVALVVVFLLSRIQKQDLSLNKPTVKVWALLAIVGLLEAVAVLSIGFGGAYGDYIIVAPIASALTIVTISLAVIFLKEKISRVQGVGIALTIIGIVMTAL